MDLLNICHAANRVQQLIEPFLVKDLIKITNIFNLFQYASALRSNIDFNLSDSIKAVTDLTMVRSRHDVEMASATTPSDTVLL